jgi:hypothetical protein
MRNRPSLSSTQPNVPITLVVQLILKIEAVVVRGLRSTFGSVVQPVAWFRLVVLFHLSP